MRVIILTIALLFSISGYAEEAKDKTILISGEDAEMNAAIKHAQATLDSFLKIKAHPPKGASDFRVKVRITDKYGTEHMWVIPFRQAGNKFIGTLADDPVYVKSVTFGQQLTFTRAEISDWGYVLNGKQKGSFTVCVIFKHLSAEEVQMYREQYGFECR